MVTVFGNDAAVRAFAKKVTGRPQALRKQMTGDVVRSAPSNDKATETYWLNFMSAGKRNSFARWMKKAGQELARREHKQLDLGFSPPGVEKSWFEKLAAGLSKPMGASL